MDHDPIRAGRTAETVTRRIEGLILEGALRPGEALLPEREMALRLNVSRPTLRDALKALEGRGLLVKRGRALVVAALGQGSIRDPLIALMADHSGVADDYLEFRDIVETSAAGMAAERATAPEIETIRQCVNRIDAAHLSRDPAEEAAADADLHIAIYEASQNLVLLQIMRALTGILRSDVLRNRQRMFTVPDIRDLLHAQHLTIAQAIIDRRPDAARAASHDHLAFVRRAMRDIDAQAANLDRSLRRLDSGGLGVGPASRD
ncbi:MAG: GntR family transcriptional regulator [Paracoccus denitrificans]|nr:MAG: GntR family transcriptional regulator [Paracoccus denitrificans]PZO84987.1 MAG: GntR family transcriptional regulator [Paracoccus denitrificans]